MNDSVDSGSTFTPVVSPVDNSTLNKTKVNELKAKQKKPSKDVQTPSSKSKKRKALEEFVVEDEDEDEEGEEGEVELSDSDEGEGVIEGDSNGSNKTIRYLFDLQRCRNTTKQGTLLLSLPFLSNYCESNTIIPIDGTTASAREWQRWHARDVVTECIVMEGDERLADVEDDEIQARGKRSEEYDESGEFQGWLEHDDAVIRTNRAILPGFFSMEGSVAIPSQHVDKEETKKKKRTEKKDKEKEKVSESSEKTAMVDEDSQIRPPEPVVTVLKPKSKAKTAPAPTLTTETATSTPTLTSATVTASATPSAPAATTLSPSSLSSLAQQLEPYIQALEAVAAVTLPLLWPSVRMPAVLSKKQMSALEVYNAEVERNIAARERGDGDSRAEMGVEGAGMGIHLRVTTPVIPPACTPCPESSRKNLIDAKDLPSQVSEILAQISQILSQGADIPSSQRYTLLGRIFDAVYMLSTGSLYRRLGLEQKSKKKHIDAGSAVHATTSSTPTPPTTSTATATATPTPSAPSTAITSAPGAGASAVAAEGRYGRFTHMSWGDLVTELGREVKAVLGAVMEKEREREKDREKGKDAREKGKDGKDGKVPVVRWPWRHLQYILAALREHIKLHAAADHAHSAAATAGAGTGTGTGVYTWDTLVDLWCRWSDDSGLGPSGYVEKKVLQKKSVIREPKEDDANAVAVATTPAAPAAVSSLDLTSPSVSASAAAAAAAAAAAVVAAAAAVVSVPAFAPPIPSPTASPAAAVFTSTVAPVLAPTAAPALAITPQPGAGTVASTASLAPAHMYTNTRTPVFATSTTPVLANTPTPAFTSADGVTNHLTPTFTDPSSGHFTPSIHAALAPASISTPTPTNATTPTVAVPNPTPTTTAATVPASTAAPIDEEAEFLHRLRVHLQSDVRKRYDVEDNYFQLIPPPGLTIGDCALQPLEWALVVVFTVIPIAPTENAGNFGTIYRLFDGTLMRWDGIPTSPAEAEHILYFVARNRAYTPPDPAMNTLTREGEEVVLQRFAAACRAHTVHSPIEVD